MIYRSSFHKSTQYFHASLRTSEGRCSQKELETIWKELPVCFHRIGYLEVQACVLMSNHLHLLIGVDEGYGDFLAVSLMVALKTLLPQIEQPGAVDLRRIESFAQYREVYRYIYRNPIEAHLVPMAELYEFSTLSELLGNKRKTIYANDKMGLISNPFPILNWINWDRPEVTSLI